MTDSATTPQSTPKSVQLIEQYGGLAQFLYQIGLELQSYYEAQIDNEEDPVKRIPLHRDMQRITTMIDLGR